MSDFGHAAVGLFAAIAPTGALIGFGRVPRASRVVVAAAACAAALVILGITAVSGDRFLDWLDISPENFQMAAALLMLPQAMHLMWRGESLGSPDDADVQRRGAWVVPLAFPLLAGPAALGAAISYGTRFGTGVTIGAEALVLTVAALLFGLSSVYPLLADGRPARPAAMLTGALLIVVAVELAVDGVRSV